MTYNYSKLLGRMREKGYTQMQLAQAISISETSLVQRLQNRLPWKQDEITAAADVLEIPIDEIPAYFFTH